MTTKDVFPPGGNGMKRDWLPLILQTITLLAGGMIYATGQEHRVTIIEESLKAQQLMIQQQYETQKIMNEQLRLQGQTLDRLVTLEDYFHGPTPAEAEGYYSTKRNKRPFQGPGQLPATPQPTHP